MSAGSPPEPEREAFLATGDAACVLSARTARVQELVRAAYEQALAPAFPRGLAALAVGGFGRAEMFPHSDVDLLLLVEQEPRAQASRDAAALMREYFLHARAVHRAAEAAMEASESAESGLLAQYRDWRSRLSNADLSGAGDRVYFKAPQQLGHDPELAFRWFEFVARHGIRPARDSERRVAEQAAALAEHCASSRGGWRMLEGILSLPHAALALRGMHASGLLRALLPDWERVECLAVRDFSHRYTVDEHTLVAIQELAAPAGAQDPPRQRLAGLWQEVGQPAVVLFALLWHDAGKFTGLAPHANESARLADSALERLQAPREVRRVVRFLIERHLDLHQIMLRRDLDDPSTARLLARRVETVERLKELTLLTYADISALHPEAMTPWRLEQLWGLYVLTHNELTRELDTERIDASATASPELAEFLEGLPVRYLRTQGEEEIQEHYRLWQLANDRGLACEIRKRNGTYSLVVAARDRPFLLASIAGVLAAFGMNILKAEAYGNRSGMVVDTFAFEDPHRSFSLNPSEVDRFRLTLERVAQGRSDLGRLLESRPKPSPSGGRPRVQPTVAFNSEASPTATLIEVVAQDRPGLLYDLASTISAAGCNIETVLIDTEARKALDVF